MHPHVFSSELYADRAAAEAFCDGESSAVEETLVWF